MKNLSLTLASQLQLTFLGLPLILIIVITVYTGFNRVSNENELKLAASVRVSQAVVDKIDRNFYERFGDVQAFAANMLAIETARHHDSLFNHTRHFINTMVGYYVLYDLMMLVDVEGKVVATNTTDKNGKKIATEFLMGKSFADTPWFRACRAPTGPEGGAWYSDLVADPLVAQIYGSRGLGMAFAAPIKDENNQVVGAWFNFASWKAVTQGIRRESLRDLRNGNPMAEIYLTNARGRIIDASDEDLILRGELTPSSGANRTDRAMNQALHLPDQDYVFGVAASTGAYTYQGKHWKCYTFLSRTRFSWATIFSPDMLLISFFMLALSLLYSRRFANGLLFKIEVLRATIKMLSQGDLSYSRNRLSGQDELNEMESDIFQLADSLHRTSRFAEEVGKGNFEAVFTPLSEKDTLGNSLLKMRANLRLSAEEERKRNWATAGFAKFADLMRSHDELKPMADALMKELIRYLPANQGGLFTVREEASQDPHIELLACYAYDRKKYHEKIIAVGEGLLGQAYLEKDAIYLTQIPEDYVRIGSGLGDGRPNCLLIVPLLVNDRVEGLLELASFHLLEPYQISFVKKLAENMGTTWAGVQTNERTRLLLEASQQKAEELMAQEEELRQNMEELAATQEEMHRKEKEYLAIIEHLRNEKDNLVE